MNKTAEAIPYTLPLELDPLSEAAPPFLVATDPDQEQKRDLERQGQQENDEQQERTGERSEIILGQERSWLQRIATVIAPLGSLGLRPNLA